MCSLNLFKGALENDMFLFHFVLELRKFKQPSEKQRRAAPTAAK